MERILKFLHENPVFYFASVDGDKPRVRPFGFFMEHEGKLYFGMGKHKESYKQVVNNPNIEVCTTNPEGQWIRIKGKAIFDESPDVQKKAFETMPMLKNIYNEKTGLTCANFYLSEGEAEICDMKGNFEKFTF